VLLVGTDDGSLFLYDPHLYVLLYAFLDEVPGPILAFVSWSLFTNTYISCNRCRIANTKTKRAMVLSADRVFFMKMFLIVILRGHARD
jgi:hypothetical protein